MKNVLQYYYNLKPTSIHQVNNDYRCQIGNVEYLFRKIENNLEEIPVIKDMNTYLLSRGLMCHQIIMNINDSAFTYIDGVPYILLKMFVANRLITDNDLLAFSSQVIEKSKYRVLDRSNWYELWTNKVDYIEYQVSQLGKNYPLIRKSINYYIGLAETAISLISNVKNNDIYLTVSHKRIKHKSKLRDLYDPLQLVLDVRVRDLTEFFKEKFFSSNVDMDNLKNTILLYKLSSLEALLLFARMIYPSYYFDCYQEIVLGEIEEKEISKYIAKATEYQELLKYLYFYLRQYYELPEVEWIIKT